MGNPNNNKCLTCGGDLIPDGRGIPTCDHCGRQYPNVAGGFSHELNEIAHRRQLREFIQAEELCRELQSKQPESSEVYWQTLLSTLGVVYVQENDKAKPTFFSYSYDDRESILDNENYKKAIQYAATEADRKYYEAHAGELDRLLKEFFSLVAREDSYDIFISFKRTVTATIGSEERQVDTDDYLKAEEIYNYLSKKYRVFYSPVSIGKDTGIVGEKFEPRILKALQTSQAMVLLGSRIEYLEAQWVQNEWRRFKYFIDKGKKSKASLILGYEKFMPRLPVALKDIQLPSFDWYKNGYLQELESQLSFVRSSKGIKSALKNRKVSSDFGTDVSFGGGYSGKRIAISDKSDSGIVISASEERELQIAESALKNRIFKEAKLKFDIILQKNPNNAKAYWGRFKACIKAATDNDVPLAITGKDAEVYFKDIDSAIDCSSDERFSWNIVDLLISALSVNVDWDRRKKVFELVIKYLDDKRTVKVLKSLSDSSFACINSNARMAEEIFDSSRQLFFEENKSEVLRHIRKFADGLYEKEYFDRARPYYEELASAQKNSEVYLRLLGCRIKAKDVTQVKFSLNVNADDDASVKKPAELDLDEIIERAIICSTKSDGKDVDNKIQSMILYQVMHNRSHVKPFIETAVSCYVQLNEEKKAIDLLLSVAESFIQLRKFKHAKTYYNEILSRDPNYSQAHWGLLMCRFKVISEVQLAKKNKRLLNLPEYTNAISCATEEEFRHYTDILNGRVSQGSAKIGLNQQAYKAYKLNKNKRLSLISFLIVLPLLLFGIASAVTAAFGVNLFYEFWAVLSLQLLGNPYYMYLFLGVFAVLLIVVLVLKGSFSRKLFTFIFNVVLSVAVVCVGGLGYWTMSAAKSADSNVYSGDGYIAVYSENSIGYTLDKIYYGGLHADIVLPSEHNGKKITELGESVISENIGDVRLTLPDSIKTIGQKAFKNSENLVYIDIPESVTSIEAGAFNGCGSLKGMSIPFVGGGDGSDATTKLFGYIFGKDKYEKGKLRKQYYSRDDNGSKYVEYCIPEELTDVTVKGGNSFQYGAFSGCNSLKSLTLPFMGTAIDGTTNVTMSYLFGSSGNTEIPSTLKTVKITGGTNIGNNAFNTCKALTNVVIPDTVTSIDYKAFYNCIGLKSIEIPDSVKIIGSEAFYGCEGLTSIEIPDSVTMIRSDAFRSCYNLKSITLPFVGADSYGEGDTSFSHIFGVVPSSLKTVKITGGEYIHENAFSDCSHITSIELPDTIVAVGRRAFGGCNSLEYNEYGNGKYLGNPDNPYILLVDVKDQNEASVNINKNTKIIMSEAFYYYSELTSIEIPASVNYIGHSAFYNCSNLNSITLPFIGNIADGTDSANFSYIFNYVPSSLKTVKITGGTSVPHSAFYNCDRITSIELPKTITSIEDYAFYGCSNLTSINIPSSVTRIASNAFGYCSKLNSVELSDSVTSIVGNAFKGCNSLEYNEYENGKYLGNSDNPYIALMSVIDTSVTSFTIADKTRVLNENLFKDCGLLTEIIIPDSVVNIGSGTFYNCSALTSVKLSSNITILYEDVFRDCGSLTSIEIPDAVTNIVDNAFYGCGELTSVKMSSSVTKIGKRAFYGCSKLESIEIPDTVTSIEDATFYGCSSLTSIVIPNSVTNIADDAFKGCSGLTSLEIPNSVTTIGFGAFSGCSGLKSITLPFVGGSATPEEASHTTLFGYIFGRDNYAGSTKVVQYYSNSNYSNSYYYVPTSLKSVTITGGSILYGAFYDCKTLTSIELLDSVTSIGCFAFYKCSNLTGIEIPDSITNIDHRAFSGCISLTTVTISASITRIGERVFESCSNLTSIEFNGTMAQWEEISKGDEVAWNFGSSIETVVCTDGTITL